jgi:nucleotide-binding universal stress UspA family protein
LGDSKSVFHSILVCFDGSEDAEAALRAAAALATKFPSDLQVLHIPELQNCSTSGMSDFTYFSVDEATVRHRADDIFARATVIVEAAGYAAVSTRLLSGMPAEAILAYARNEAVDLIVAGRQGLGTMHGSLLGSVAQKLISHAKCPVLTVQR